jgi:hypothetical protein
MSGSACPDVDRGSNVDRSEFEMLRGSNDASLFGLERRTTVNLVTSTRLPVNANADSPGRLASHLSAPLDDRSRVNAPSFDWMLVASAIWFSARSLIAPDLQRRRRDLIEVQTSAKVRMGQLRVCMGNAMPAIVKPIHVLQRRRRTLGAVGSLS